ncbi:MAG: sigma-70 family RNA polymerase sigma factor [Kiritimatiellae bacterium]|nr:sigma-70 family RNA polymerase sigma factor [Kiritimatiellia bacterium]
MGDATQGSDGELVTRFVETGSDAAFEALVRRHSGMVFAACRRGLGGNAAQAEDAAQAVFIMLAQRARRIRNRRAVAAWLFWTANSVVSNMRREAARRRRREQKAVAMHEAEHRTESGLSWWTGIEEHLNEAISGLRERYRQAVVLRFLEGMSQREVAHAIGCSEEAARKHIARGLEGLRRNLARRGAVIPVAALAVHLAEQAAEAATAGLAASCHAAAMGAVTGGAVAASVPMGIAKGAMKMILWAKVKTAAAVAGAVAIAGVGAAGMVKVLAETKPAPAEEIARQPSSVYAPPDPYALFGVEKSGRGREWDLLMRYGSDSVNIGRQPIGGKTYCHNPALQPGEARRFLADITARQQKSAGSVPKTWFFAFGPLNKLTSAGVLGSSRPSAGNYMDEATARRRWQESVNGKWDRVIMEAARELVKLREKGMKRVVIGFYGGWGGEYNMFLPRNLDFARYARQAWNRYAGIYDQVAREAGVPGFFLFDLNLVQTDRTPAAVWREALPLRDGDRKPDFIGFDKYDNGRVKLDTPEKFVSNLRPNIVFVCELAVSNNVPLTVPEWACGADGDNPEFCHLMADFLHGCDGTVHAGKGRLEGRLPKRLWPRLGFHIQFNPSTSETAKHSLQNNPKFARAFIERFGIPAQSARNTNGP